MYRPKADILPWRFERIMLISQEHDSWTKFGMHTHLNEGYLYQKWKVDIM